MASRGNLKVVGWCEGQLGTFHWKKDGTKLGWIHGHTPGARATVCCQEGVVTPPSFISARNHEESVNY